MSETTTSPPKERAPADAMLSVGLGGAIATIVGFNWDLIAGAAHPMPKEVTAAWAMIVIYAVHAIQVAILYFAGAKKSP